jgi:hypothetical protein
MRILSYLLAFMAINLPFTSYVAATTINTELCMPSENIGDVYYVSVNGRDYKGDGSIYNPWRNIEFAISQAKDLSTIIVTPGVYVGTTRVKKAFNKALLIKSERPYLAKLTHNARILAIVGSAENITIEGFEFTHNTETPQPVLVHIDGYGSYSTPKTVSNITLRNNIFHDSYNNDLLKINNGAKNIKVHCNIFYNQGDSDEHIDVNSVTNVDIADNIFFNDFPASNRNITKKSSSFIVVKDSNDHEDKLIGAKNINIHRNVFFNWQGSHGHGFILIGEDGKPYYEAKEVNIYNNLMLGNSNITMRSPLGIKGAKHINFFNNTITGDLPSNAYAIRINKEGANKVNDEINFYNNIWSDATGTMGQGDHESDIDFSDVLPNQLNNFTLDNNLIYNGENTLPSSFFDKINPNDDKNMIHANPFFPDSSPLIPPVWLSSKNTFADGSFTIRTAFIRLVLLYGTPENKKIIQLHTNNNYLPTKDILGKERTIPYSVGASSPN